MNVHIPVLLVEELTVRTCNHDETIVLEDGCLGFQVFMDVGSALKLHSSLTEALKHVKPYVDDPAVEKALHEFQEKW